MHDEGRQKNFSNSNDFIEYRFKLIMLTILRSNMKQNFSKSQRFQF